MDEMSSELTHPPAAAEDTSPAHPKLWRLPEPRSPCQRRRGTDGRPGPVRRRDPSLPQTGGVGMRQGPTLVIAAGFRVAAPTEGRGCRGGRGSSGGGEAEGKREEERLRMGMERAWSAGLGRVYVASFAAPSQKY